jgi:hydroxymethylpyrimidine/phosphomethylpyrimidine kinase
MSSSLPVVLTFAASDPTGGAGLQADLLTLASLGCHPLSVVTGLTVQDTRGVESMLAIEPALVERQARHVLADIPVAVFKVGVVGSAGNARVIAAILAEFPAIPLVFDPVLASGRGDTLADGETIEVFRGTLLPRTTVLTPNSLEARRLTGSAPGAALSECARELTKRGCKFVLVTGTHEKAKEVVNTLYDASGLVRDDRWQRLPGSYHGSGCTLASAIAALLAKGLAIDQAVRQAQEYTWKSLAAGFSPGRGQSIPERFFESR